MTDSIAQPKPAQNLDPQNLDPVNLDPVNLDPVNLDPVNLGAGFSGLVMLHKLQSDLGLDARVIDKADGIGGTWFWNCYPGAGSDTIPGKPVADSFYMGGSGEYMKHADACAGAGYNGYRLAADKAKAA